jgi:hypothetical protein
MGDDKKDTIFVKQTQDDKTEIPVFEIIDPYGYVHSNRVIAYIQIKGTNGNQRRELVRTKKGGYIMYA